MRSKVSLCLLKVFLLSLVVISLQVGIPKVESQFYDYYYPDVTLHPSSPTTSGNINMTVSFVFASAPPHVEEFGPLIQDGNTFSVNISIYVPAPWEAVLLIVHADSYTYNLGNLSAGGYEFEVSIHHIHYTEGMSYIGTNIAFQVNWNIADINGDLKVDFFDVVLGTDAYGATPLDPHWNLQCDLAKPYGEIDIFDIVMICTNYGEGYTP